MASYNKLGDQCSQRTIALTSNHKFFPPLDAIYWKDWVPIYTLDGNKPIKSNEVKHQHFGTVPTYDKPMYLRRDTYCGSCNK